MPPGLRHQRQPSTLLLEVRRLSLEPLPALPPQQPLRPLEPIRDPRDLILSINVIPRIAHLLPYTPNPWYMASIFVLPCIGLIALSAQHILVKSPDVDLNPLG